MRKRVLAENRSSGGDPLEDLLAVMFNISIQTPALRLLLAIHLHVAGVIRGRRRRRIELPEAGRLEIYLYPLIPKMRFRYPNMQVEFVFLASPPSTFVFEVSAEYAARTSTYEACVEMQILARSLICFVPGDLRIIRNAAVAVQHIYQFGRYAEADFYLRRALYAIQSWIHQDLRLWQLGKPVYLTTIITFVGAFLCLHAHARACRQGFHKAAFALLTLVFACDPRQDPCGALLDLDVYAIKAKRSDFVTNACSVLGLRAASQFCPSDSFLSQRCDSLRALLSRFLGAIANECDCP